MTTKTTKSPTKTDWAYLAGFWDGEGSILMSRRRPHLPRKPRLTLDQRDGDFLRGVQSVFGIGTIYVTGRGSTRWAINSREDTQVALLGMRPYLRLKREKCDVALAFWETEA